MPESISVIGFDFGSAWIGSAIGQTQTGTASPLKPLRVINNKPDWNGIKALIDEWAPDRLIVGLPKHMDDRSHQMTQKANRFARQLEGRFQLPTELIDERLTTREAWLIIEELASQRLNKPDIDCIAAVLITETWLNHHPPASD